MGSDVMTPGLVLLLCNAVSLWLWVEFESGPAMVKIGLWLGDLIDHVEKMTDDLKF
jgi:hypothetical protein